MTDLSIVGACAQAVDETARLLERLSYGNTAITLRVRWSAVRQQCEQDEATLTALALENALLKVPRSVASKHDESDPRD